METKVQAKMPNFGVATNTISLPCLAYKSGGRIWYSTTMSLSSLAKFIVTTTTRNKKKNSISKDIRNRFLDPKHKQEIKEYLRIEKEFILPPITLVSTEELSFRPFLFDETTSKLSLEEHLEKQGSVAGVLFLPLEYTFDCLDGNHRTAAIREIAEEEPELIEGSSILINIVHETRIRKIRQDFVDINKNAKATTSSINTVFDTRNPVAQIVADLRDNIDYLYETTELFAASVSKNSKDIYTINNIKNSVIEIAGYNSQSTGEKKLVIDLKNEETKNKLLKHATLFFEKLRYNRFISECLHNPARTPAVRLQSVLTSGTGIIIASRLAGYVFKYYQNDQADRQLERIVNFDWARSNPIFRGNIVVGNDYKLVNSRDAINKAYESISSVLGFTISK